MSWGVPRRPKISTKIGRPTPRDGSDGDIQIRGTQFGAKLFAKWAGRWFGTPDLTSSEEERLGVFTPKIWQYTIEDTSTNTQFYIPLPNFITKANFLTATINAKVQVSGSSDFWFLSRNGATGTWESTQNALFHYILYLSWTNRRLDLSGFGSADSSQFENTEVIANVFYKG